MYRLFAGAYDVGQGGAIHSLSVAEDALQIDAIEVVRLPDPTYVNLSTDGRSVLAASEVEEFDGVAGGGVTRLRIEGDSLVVTTRHPTGGRWSCYVTDTAGVGVLAANYLDGTVSAFLGHDETPITIDFAHHTKVMAGQRAFVHCVVQRPGHLTAFAVAAGLDEVIEISLDPQDPWIRTAYELPSGSRPRHLVFSADGNYGYLVTEATSELHVLQHHRRSGDLELTQIHSTIPAEFVGRSVAAAVRISPDELTLIATNRGHDSVAVFERDPLSGGLEHTQIQCLNDGGDVSGPLTDNMPISGSFPRDAAFSSDGRVIAVALQRSGEVVVLEVLGRARVSAPRCRTEVPGAASVVFSTLA